MKLLYTIRKNQFIRFIKHIETKGYEVIPNVNQFEVLRSKNADDMIVVHDIKKGGFLRIQTNYSFLVNSFKRSCVEQDKLKIKRRVIPENPNKKRKREIKRTANDWEMKDEN